MTITIQIGNSDNKLPQADWADFINELYGMIGDYYKCNIHFFGHSMPNAPWQNCAIVFESDWDDEIRLGVEHLARKYHQNSIAVTIGETLMVKP